MTFIDEWGILVVASRELKVRIAKFMARGRKSTSDQAICCRTNAAPKLSTAHADEYAGWFKALADPTRIRILNLLAVNGDPVCVCDIVKQFPIGQPTISHHLKILRDTRFVLAERRGTFMYYRVNRNCLGEFPAAARRIMNV